MISEPWRKRLIYALMSLFVTWHTLAIVVGPTPDSSEIMQLLRPVLYPYLTLFRLDNRWDFYAPEIGNRHQFRYVVVDGSGRRHLFRPADELNWFHPTYWWFRAWYDAIMNFPDDYAKLAATFFCRKHETLHPIEITFLKVDEQDFSPADHLDGKHPLDAPFVSVSTLKRVKCQDT
jgi:hypothetical protein